MTLAYHKVYNERAVAGGEPYDLSALSYLDENFKTAVTKTLELCLCKRPEDPIRFFVDCLRAQEKKARQAAALAIEEARRNSMLSSKEMQGTPLISQDTASSGRPPLASNPATTNTRGSNASADGANSVNTTIMDATEQNSANVVLDFSGGVSCTVAPAHTGRGPAPQLDQVGEHVPCAKFLVPNVYDVETILNHLEATISFHNTKEAVAPTLLVVEPPPSPQEVVFLKGIPYVTELTEKLQYQLRRGNAGAPRPEAGQTFTQTALTLLRERLGEDLMSLTEAIDQTVAVNGRRPTSDNAAQGGKRVGASAQRRVVYLPSARTNCWDTFDLVDKALIDIMYPSLSRRGASGTGGEQRAAADGSAASSGSYGGAPKLFPEPAYKSPPLVVFLSYNSPDAANLTYSRVLASFFPFVERCHLVKMREIAAEVLEAQKTYNLSYCVQYWDDVHRRREERDVARGATSSKRLGSSRGKRGQAGPAGAAASSVSSVVTPIAPSSQAPTGKNTRPPTPLNYEDGDAAEDGGAPAEPPGSRRGVSPAASSSARPTSPSRARKASGSTEAAAADARKKAAAMRDARRQAEDTEFLDVVRDFRAAAATRIQSVFRTHLVRRALAEQRSAEAPEKNAAAAFVSKQVPTGAVHAKKLPADVPLLIQLVLQRVSAVHGELFGNYDVGRPAAPARVKIVRPKRRRLPAPAGLGNEEDSETEEWETTTALRPQKRSMLPAPHFNPLRRLLEYHHLAECTVLDGAVRLQRECTGMSKMQHHAYDLLKSVALSLLHIAYTELYHRGKLGVDVVLFSHFLSQHHSAVLSWFSMPHYVSTAEYIARQPSAEDTARVIDEELQLERVLLPAVPLSCVFPEVVQNDDVMRRVSKNIYTTVPALPVKLWEAALRRIAAERSELPGSASDTTNANAADGKTPGNGGSAGDGKGKTSSNSSSGKKPSPSAAELGVSWWAMCPHPMVYINDHPFVEAPRSDSQEVEGRARYDEFVLRSSRYHFDPHAPTPSHRQTNTTSANSAGGAAAANSPRGPFSQKDGDAEAETAASKDSTEAEVFSETGAGVVMDGMEYRLTETSSLRQETKLPRQSIYAVQENRLRAVKRNEALATFLGRNAFEADATLKKLIESKARAGGKITYFIKSSGNVSSASNGRGSNNTANGASAEDPFLFGLSVGGASYAQLRRSKYLAMQKLSVETITAPAVERRPNTNPTAANTATVSPPSSGRSMSSSSGRSGRLRSSSRGDNWSKVVEAVAERRLSSPPSRRSSIVPAYSAPPSSALTSAMRATNLSLAQQNHDAPNVRSTTSAAEEVNRNVTEVSLELLRTATPAIVAGSEWMAQFEVFVEHCVRQLRESRPIVIAHEDTTQWVYVAAAAIAGNAIEDAAAANAMATMSISDENKSEQRPTPRSLSDEARGALAFMEGFYEVVGDELRNSGVKVAHSVHLVEVALEETATSDFHCLEALARHIHDAETSPSAVECRRHIAEAARLSEQLCWLTLLQIFLLMPFNAGALDAQKRAPLTSFSSFAQNTKIQEWVRTLDPWAKTPERCPDVSHLRYSNGLRRWDNRDYVCYGPI